MTGAADECVDAPRIEPRHRCDPSGDVLVRPSWAMRPQLLSVPLELPMKLGPVTRVLRGCRLPRRIDVDDESRAEPVDGQGERHAAERVSDRKVCAGRKAFDEVGG